MNVYSYDGDFKSAAYAHSGSQLQTVYDAKGNPMQSKTFSVLGDSISTFRGYTENPWYPDANNNVKDVTQTWWHLLSKETGLAMASNISYSGSCICYNGIGEGTADQADRAFITRMPNLVSADYIFVFGGTNDSWMNVAELGEYQYSDWTEADKEKFRPATAYMLDYLMNAHPESRIVFILNAGLRAEINTSIETVCKHYGVDLLKLSGIDTQNGHPSINGMIAIKNQIRSYLNL
jgi:hypothetical protein